MIPERPHTHKVTHGSPFDDDYSGPPIRPKWLRPETGGPNARAFYHARTAITDAMHAGDPTNGLIHWQPLNALIRKQLIEVVGQDNGRVVALTDTGRAALT